MVEKINSARTQREAVANRADAFIFRVENIGNMFLRNVR
jgi:hypothetical protein